MKATSNVMGSLPSVLIQTYGIHASLPALFCLTGRREISLPHFWNPGSEDVASTESTPEITGDISQSRPVQFSLAPSAFASHLLSPYPSRPAARRPTVALERRSAYFPGPANQTRPLKQRRNYHISLSFSTSPPLRRVPPVCESQSVSRSSLPARQACCASHYPRQRVPSLSARSIPRSDITPGQSGPIGGGVPPALPCVRACARMHAQHGSSSRLLQDPPGYPPPWRSRDRECRSASNLPVSCISCISRTS